VLLGRALTIAAPALAIRAASSAVWLACAAALASLADTG
jgi:hypothetical protein